MPFCMAHVLWHARALHTLQKSISVHFNYTSPGSRRVTPFPPDMCGRLGIHARAVDISCARWLKVPTDATACVALGHFCLGALCLCFTRDRCARQRVISVPLPRCASLSISPPVSKAWCLLVLPPVGALCTSCLGLHVLMWCRHSVLLASPFFHLACFILLACLPGHSRSPRHQD